MLNRFFTEVKYEPEFTLLNILQLLALIDAIIILTAFETVGILLVLFAAGYFKVMQRRLEYINITEDRNLQIRVTDSDMKNCIIFHQKILQ